mmetsp:Transcript_8895/g.21190  ORF Transcript_8895/g.21190 Transcript_8895/m.21190 type:complete len:159 (+) Transcript_8895:104-580(+)|eukprot:CAMPEP_0113643800 /NCGR_PEP_ID=MMETSP0017_2-20120614/23041_1 /TAXON_ID=2856 /ORGANISM="Cylindrotheca closterium" /LENGTH=158 /DNA_ID=CAMNT_0000555355 /DNA_START=14 /DNA_END=490 /DNA_ORIENTATION=+ /assembly_acc=CAM_ASM_000147
MSQNSNKRMSLEEFDATGAAASSSVSAHSQATPTSSASSATVVHYPPPASAAAHPMAIPAKKKPAWYRKAQEEKDSQNMQECLEDYFGRDAFRLGQGEQSIETVVEGHDVAIIWDTERNRMVGYPRPKIETTFRRRVVHDALFEDYTQEYSEDEDDEY